LRIAHLLSSFLIGGQERVALDLAERQQRDGHAVIAVSLAAGPDGPMAVEFTRAGAARATVPKGEGLDLTLPIRLARLFRRERIQIVHTHNPQPLIYGAPAARAARARVIHTKHGANPDGGRRLTLLRSSARLVDAYVAVSEITARIARERREAPEERLRVIENGIDLDRFHPDADARAAVRAELAIPPGAWVAGTVGRLSAEKDQALLLRAVAPLLDEETRLLVVGDGAEAAALGALARSLPAGRFIHLLGARSDVPRLLTALDAFVLSSRTEGLPLVIPEAMAAGLPVVSTAVGGIPMVIDPGATGFLVPAGDEAALRDRLRDLRDRRDEARACGQRAREVALRRYSADRMARDYFALYTAAFDRA
jgi:glycosyltransferase involved in cell wall biosynthesis